MTETVCKVDDCDLIIIPERQYYRSTKAPGTAPLGGYGMCKKHYNRWVRNGTTERKQQHRPAPRSLESYRVYRTREEVLEEYAMVRRDVTSVRQAAERMGMTFSALDMALYRARKLGDERALPPPAQIDRAIANGSWQAA